MYSHGFPGRVGPRSSEEQELSARILGAWAVTWKLGRQIPFIDGEPPRIEPFTFTTYHTLFVFIFDMSQPSTLQDLFNAALQDYKDKTGNNLADHPFARQLQECNSVESISTILEEQARVFRGFRDHGKFINSLKRLAGILYSPFISTVLAEGVVRPKSTCRCTPLVIVIPAIAACESNIYWLCHPTRRMSLILRSHLHISVTSKSRRRSKTLVLVTTRS